MIKINGAYLEGGGQILRTAVGLSAVTGKAFEIINIRAGRKNTRGDCGMKEQHVQAVKAVKKLCNADVEGLEIGSSKLVFRPNKITKKKLDVKIGTAGSTSLVLQSLLLASFLKAKENLIQVNIEGGGTWNKWAPSAEYIKDVFGGFMKGIGLNFKLEVLREGFYPKGGARVRARWKVDELKGVDLVDVGDLRFVHGVSVASRGLKRANVAGKQVDSAYRFLGKSLDCGVKIGVRYVDTWCAGSGMLIVGEFDDFSIGFDIVGEKGKLSEVIGKECAEGFVRQIERECCVDEKLFDQVLPFLALTGKNSRLRFGRMTKHAKTNMRVIKQFLDVDFKVNEEEKILDVVF